MEHDEFLQVIRSPFHFATCDAVLRGCKIVDRSKPLQWRRLSKKVRSPLGPLCEGAPPAGGGGENCTVARCKPTTTKQQPRTHRASGAFFILTSQNQKILTDPAKFASVFDKRPAGGSAQGAVQAHLRGIGKLVENVVFQPRPGTHV
mgnify:FL=1